MAEIDIANLFDNVFIDSTVNERAADIARDAILLNAKLSTFVVSGTTEPRVVRLFPKTTCSCPAAGGCYHIAAAKRAVGIDDTQKRRVLNLTQLRRNTRKRPDKTSGRKRPRTADVDVVAAGDGDDEQLQAVVRKVCRVDDRPASTPPGQDGENNSQDDVEPTVASSAPPHSTPPQPSQPTDARVDSRCVECGLEEPPLNIFQGRYISWVQCSVCCFWYHQCCIHKRVRKSAKFTCARCVH